MKLYDATYAVAEANGKPAQNSVVPIAAQSLVHAARKAEAERNKRNATIGELVKLELTDRVII